MFPKIRQVSGRAITVESTAAGLRAALATGAGRLVGTLKNCSVITGTWRVRLEKKRTSGASAAVASSSTSPPWAAKAPPPRSVPPRTSSTAPWATPKSLSEVDDSDQTALLRTALALFENCDLPPGVLDEIRKVIPPHRPPTRKALKVSREQIVLNMKKKHEKEEQELRDR